jgi:CheY-like chemotaxis protein
MGVIAVIDDDPSVRALVRLHLAACGCEVLEAADGVAGRHLILLDAAAAFAGPLI